MCLFANLGWPCSTAFIMQVFLLKRIRSYLKKLKSNSFSDYRIEMENETKN